MNKKEFLRSLRKNLAFLKKEDLEREVLYYINKIDSSKEDDKDVIKSFGTMEEIVSEVSKKYKIKSTKKEFWFKRFYNELVDLSTILKNSDGKKRGKIIFDVLFLVAITCFLKIPFIFVRDLGDQVINVFLGNNINFLAIWGLIIEIIYVIVALSYFVKTFEKWFSNMK